MWAKFQALESKTKWKITAAVVALFVLAAIYGSPS